MTVLCYPRTVMCRLVIFMATMKVRNYYKNHFLYQVSYTILILSAMFTNLTKHAHYPFPS